MVKILTKNGWHTHPRFPGDPVFYHAPKHRIKSVRAEWALKIYPSFPPVISHVHNNHHYRPAVMSDLDSIIEFVDHLLAGKDFFCPRGQHIGYFEYKTILVCFDSSKLIGWAVRQRNGSLIHLLIDPDYRGQGIGTHLLKLLDPLLIRSKFDQSTGDPLPFYEKHGYHKTSDERIGKHKNIDLLSK